jgi:hypothetical protein
MTAPDAGTTAPPDTRPPTRPPTTPPGNPPPQPPKSGLVPLADVVRASRISLAATRYRLHLSIDPATLPGQDGGVVPTVVEVLLATLRGRVAEALELLTDIESVAASHLSPVRVGAAGGRTSRAADPARQGLPARGLGGPSVLRLLPGDTGDDRAGSAAAAGGSAVGLGRSGAGSEPSRAGDEGAVARPGQDAVAPDVPLGRSPEPASQAALGAGDQLEDEFTLPPAPPSWARPVGGREWPGTRDIALQVAEGARRRARDH